MALLPDLESAEQAYERGWNEAIKADSRNYVSDFTQERLV